MTKNTTAQSVKGAVKHSANNLKERAYDTGVKAVDQAQTLKSMAKDKLEAGSEYLQEQAYLAGAKAKEALRQGQETLQAGVSSLEEQIRARPLTAVSVAVVVGALLGGLLSRRN